jgi:hypothetical protein
MPEKFSPEAEKVIQKIAKSKEPFQTQTLKRLLKMDPNHEVLIQHSDGKVVPANEEVLIRIMEVIYSPRQKIADTLTLVPKSESQSSPAASESPRQADEANGKDEESKKLA